MVINEIADPIISNQAWILTIIGFVIAVTAAVSILKVRPTMRNLIWGISGNALWEVFRLLLYATATALVAHGGLFKGHPRIRFLAGSILLLALVAATSFWFGRRKAAIVTHGNEAVFSKAEEIMTSSTTSIKVLLMGNSPPAPPEFGHKLSKYLKEHPMIGFCGIIVTEKLDTEFWKRNDERLGIYRGLGVPANQMSLSVVRNPQPMGFDVVIVDDRHVQLAFSPVSVTNSTREMAILLRNNPKLARHLAKWFDGDLPGKQSYADARREWEENQGARQRPAQSAQEQTNG